MSPTGGEKDKEAIITTLAPQLIPSAQWAEYYLFHNELKTETKKDDLSQLGKEYNKKWWYWEGERGEGGVPRWPNARDQKPTQQAGAGSTGNVKSMSRWLRRSRPRWLAAHEDVVHVCRIS